MRNFSSVAWALAISSLAVTSPTFAAEPATVPPTNESTPVAKLDPAAVAMLDESVKAYAALSGLSMDYQVHNVKGTKQTDLSGTVAFSGPDKAKVVIKDGKESIFTLTDGAKLYVQADAKTVQGNPIDNGIAREVVLGRVPSAASVPLPVMVAGKSPLTLAYMKWQSAEVVPYNGIKLVAMPGGKPLTFNLYFDATTKLLRRVEFLSNNDGQKTQDVTMLSNIQSNPTFAADAFTFTPGNGIKLVAELPMFDQRLQVGKAPFELKGKDLSGKAHTWKQYAGKVVLLDFWATWCGPCVGELPNVLKNYKTYHPKGFEIVGVSLDDDKKKLTDFIKARNLQYVNLFDGQGWKNVDAQNYAVRAVPFTLLIGKDGKIAAVNPRGDKLEPALKAALAKK